MARWRGSVVVTLWRCGVEVASSPYGDLERKRRHHRKWCCRLMATWRRRVMLSRHGNMEKRRREALLPSGEMEGGWSFHQAIQVRDHGLRLPVMFIVSCTSCCFKTYPLTFF
ncbi:hypothetical protein Rs2_02926 [Raphanus sativus]|nr:hypothetical protein Rs2_02926 [Raphanus sativus]